MIRRQMASGPRRRVRRSRPGPGQSWLPGPDRGIGGADDGGVRAEHLAGHVQAVRPAMGADAASRAEAEGAFARARLGHGGGVAAAEGSGDGFGGQGVVLVGGVAGGAEVLVGLDRLGGRRDTWAPSVGRRADGGVQGAGRPGLVVRMRPAGPGRQAAPGSSGSGPGPRPRPSAVERASSYVLTANYLLTAKRIRACSSPCLIFPVTLMTSSFQLPSTRTALATAHPLSWVSRLGQMSATC